MWRRAQTTDKRLAKVKFWLQTCENFLSFYRNGRIIGIINDPNDLEAFFKEHGDKDRDMLVAEFGDLGSRNGFVIVSKDDSVCLVPFEAIHQKVQGQSP